MVIPIQGRRSNPLPSKARKRAPLPCDANEPKAEADPFDEIDFGSFFDDYLDPGYKTPSSESVEKPSFETFLSSPVTLGEHLQRQLAMEVLSEPVRDAAMAIIGNLDDNGYLPISIEEIAESERHSIEEVQAALQFVQSLDPSGIAARDMRECLLIQIESRNGKGGVAWEIIANHMRLLETKQFKEIAKQLGRPLEHVQIAVNMIRHLDPRPGLRYSGQSARIVEPDVYIFKDADDVYHSTQ